MKTGARGPNLVGVLGDAHGMILQALGNGIGLLDDGKDTNIELTAACCIDFTGSPFRQLRLPTVAARLEHIRFRLVARISQTLFEYDRGANFDFAVMLESYVSDQRLIAHRRPTDPGINFQVVNPGELGSSGGGDTLSNGSIMKIHLAPWIGIAKDEPGKRAFAGQLIRVLVDVVGGRPQLALRFEPLNIPPPP